MRFLAWLFKTLLKFSALVAVILFAVNLYFRHVDPIASQVRDAAKARIASKHIQPLTYRQIPEVFRYAIVATEDRRFTWDPGVDPVGILRSIVVDVEKDGYVEGGSTITQQLVDNTILGKQKTITRKLKQTFYAIGLYDTLSKDETFTLYVNVIYYGNGAYGLQNAAYTYFGRPVSQLNSGELTMLAGLPNAPSAYDPFHSMQLARARQRIVIDNMVDSGVLTTEEAAAIYNMPIHLKMPS